MIEKVVSAGNQFESNLRLIHVVSIENVDSSGDCKEKRVLAFISLVHLRNCTAFKIFLFCMARAFISLPKGFPL